MTRMRPYVALALMLVCALAAAPLCASRPGVEDRSYVAALSGPCGIAIDGADRKIIADTGNNRVIVLDANFEPVGVIEALVRKVEPLKQPQGVACDANDRIIVADTGNHCVKVFDKEGYHQFTIGTDGTPGSHSGEFRSPEGVAVDGRGNIIVFDTGNKRVQIFDGQGGYIMQFRRGEYSVKKLSGPPEDPTVATVSGEIALERPVRGCVLGDGNLVVADYELGRYSVWQYNTSKKTAAPLKYTEPKEIYADHWAGDVAYDAQHNEIFYVQAHSPLNIDDLVRVAKVRADELAAYPEEMRALRSKPEDWPPYYEISNVGNGRLREPRAIAIDSKGNAVIVDRALNCAVQIDRREIERQWRYEAPPFPHRIVQMTPTSAVIEYDTLDSVPTRLEYSRIDEFHYGGTQAYETPIDKEKPAFHHRVRLGGLEPGTRYVYHYLTSSKAYPRAHFCEPRILTTPPGPGKTAMLDLEVLIVLFTDIVTMPAPDELAKDDAGNPIVPARPGPMTPAEIARVKADLERARGFYWINSHMKMNLRFDWLEISDAYEGFPFERYAYYPLEDRKKLDEIITAHGRRTHGDRGGIIVIYGARQWDSAAQAWVLSGSGGNTWGSPYDGSGICVFNAGGDTAWLFVHEYGHQLDIMASQFGHRYHFNHFHDNDLEGDYGTHWDGNAFIARTFEPSSYLANFYGEVRIVRDADDDGVPDDDPYCPFDEKRFGTRTDSADSDRDGVGDLAEAMFSEWPPDGGLDFVTFDARTAHPYHRPQPYNDDTDGDGIRDVRDAFPLDALWPEAAKADITIDGTAADGEWQEHSTRVIDDPAFTGAVRINWRDEGLCFLIEQQVGPEQAEAYKNSDRPMQVMVRFDGNNDGWTVGSDNGTIWLDAKPDGTAAVQTEHWDNSTRTHYTRTENTVIKPEDVRAAWTLSDGRFVFEFMIPRNIEAGINCVPGEPLGFELEFRAAGMEHGLRLFEPQVLFDITLK